MLRRNEAATPDHQHQYPKCAAPLPRRPAAIDRRVELQDVPDIQDLAVGRVPDELQGPVPVPAASAEGPATPHRGVDSRPPGIEDHRVSHRLLGSLASGCTELAARHEDVPSKGQR